MAAGSVMKCVVIVSVCGIVFLSTGCDAMGKTCMFGCMRTVIGCKRKALAVQAGLDACCEEYYRCYFDCKPDAMDTPPCDSNPGKRGSWSKRYGDQFPLPLDFANF